MNDADLTEPDNTRPLAELMADDPNAAADLLLWQSAGLYVQLFLFHQHLRYLENHA